MELVASPEQLVLKELQEILAITVLEVQEARQAQKEITALKVLQEILAIMV